MATWDDVRAIALSLPEADEGSSYGAAAWRVRGALFAWERPLRASDRAALGDGAPSGPILGVRVADLGAKEALLSADGGYCFTTPHFDGYPSVLVRLDAVPDEALRELIVESWLARAPKRIAQAYLAETGGLSNE
jgi:hypothetical protein